MKGYFFITSLSFLILIRCSSYEKYLNMSYVEFDQRRDGWRYFISSKEANYQKAAELLIYYIQNKNGLNKYENNILYFHVGQMHAYLNSYQLANFYFTKSFTENDNGLKSKYWNIYVKATICFLDKDSNGLIECYEEMKKLPFLDGTQPNLPFLESFIKNIDKPYKEIYYEVTH